MGRGMDVLSALATLTVAHPRGVSVSTVAAFLERDRSQVSRTLAHLASMQLAERTSLGYTVSPHPYAHSQALTETRLRTGGLTALEALSAETGEACFLGELYGDSTVTIAESVPPEIGLLGSWVGRAYPAFCSDAGQAVLWDANDAEIRDVFAQTDFTAGGPQAPRNVDAFLARLETSRQRGFSIVEEEAEPGLMSVAAPVFDFRGEVVAAMQVVGTVERLQDRIHDLGTACQRSAQRLSGHLTGQSSQALGN